MKKYFPQKKHVGCSHTPDELLHAVFEDFKRDSVKASVVCQLQEPAEKTTARTAKSNSRRALCATRLDLRVKAALSDCTRYFQQYDCTGAREAEVTHSMSTFGALEVCLPQHGTRNRRTYIQVRGRPDEDALPSPSKAQPHKSESMWPSSRPFSQFNEQPWVQ